MIGGIVTALALVGFLAVVVWVFVIKRREDFDEQAHQPLEDRDDSATASNRPNTRENGQ